MDKDSLSALRLNHIAPARALRAELLWETPLTQKVDTESIGDDIVRLLEGNIRDEEEGKTPCKGPSIQCQRRDSVCCIVFEAARVGLEFRR